MLNIFNIFRFLNFKYSFGFLPNFHAQSALAAFSLAEVTENE